MNSTNNLKATLGQKIPVEQEDNMPNTAYEPDCQDKITISIVRSSENDTIGHIVIDFEKKRRRDYYREINRKLEEGWKICRM